MTKTVPDIGNTFSSIKHELCTNNYFRMKTSEQITNENVSNFGQCRVSEGKAVGNVLAQRWDKIFSAI